MRPFWQWTGIYFLRHCECFRSGGVLDLHIICAACSAPRRQAELPSLQLEISESAPTRCAWAEPLNSNRASLKGPGTLCVKSRWIAGAAHRGALQQQVCSNMTFPTSDTYIYPNLYFASLRSRPELRELQRLNVAETAPRVVINDLRSCYRALKSFRVAGCGDRCTLLLCCIFWWRSRPLCRHLGYLSSRGRFYKQENSLEMLKWVRQTQFAFGNTF